MVTIIGRRVHFATSSDRWLYDLSICPISRQFGLGFLASPFCSIVIKLYFRFYQHISTSTIITTIFNVIIRNVLKEHQVIFELDRGADHGVSLYMNVLQWQITQSPSNQQADAQNSAMLINILQFYKWNQNMLLYVCMSTNSRLLTFSQHNRKNLAELLDDLTKTYFCSHLHPALAMVMRDQILMRCDAVITS